MTKTYLLLIITFFLLSVYCQDENNPLDKTPLDCYEIANNNSLLFVKYVKEDNTDSVKYLLNYWEKMCGLTEPVFRAKILWALKKEEFNDSLLSKTPLNYFFNYQSRMDIITFIRYYVYQENQSFYGYVPVGERFDNYTRWLASALKTIYEPESTEYLLTEFYSDDYESILFKIQDENFKGSFLHDKYHELLNKYIKKPEFHFSFFTGIWIPTGELKKVGVHPDLGIQLGLKRKKINYDFTFSIKFAKSSEKYYARSNKCSDEWEETDSFLGGYMGFEIGGDLISKKRHELQVVGGVGYDGFYVLDETASTSSYNLNLGLTYRYYVSNNFYVGLKVKYNLVNYALNSIIDFTGNPVTVHFSLGIVRNNQRNIYLSALGYPLRK